MPQQSSPIDCIIIGYHDTNGPEMESELRRLDEYSGAYRYYTTNFIPVDGRRISYMDLLNRTLGAATGKPHDLQVARLPNLGACYLYSYLAKRGLRVEQVNYFNVEQDQLQRLLQQEVRAVAITTTFYVEHRPIQRIIEFVRNRNPEVKVIVGGPHIYNICSDNDEFTQDYIFDQIGADFYIFDSQGESTLQRLLAALKAGRDDSLEGIPNLIQAAAPGTYHRTDRVAESNDMNECVVDWRLFDQQFIVPTVQTRTARSCAFSCAFCRYPVLAGSLSLTDIEVVEKELQTLHWLGVRNVVFIDDTFNVPLPRFKKLLRMMIRNDFQFNWFSYFRCSNADRECFDLMKESGCWGVFLGIESGDQTILNNMNKYAKIDRYKEGIENLNQRGILTFASIIVGYPGETEQTVTNTMDFIESAAPTFYRGELYYHDQKAPVGEKAAHYGLEHSGYSWKHNTMGWQKACEMVEHMYRNVRHSTILPLHMFDFWSLPYLVGEGLSREQIVRFAQIAQAILVEGLGRDDVDSRREQRQLVELFAGARADGVVS